MSLNKLTNSSDYLNKQFLNIGCNDIKCSTLEVGGVELGKSGKYNPTVTINIPGSTVTPGFIYYNVVGKQLHLTFSRIIILGANSNNFTLVVPLPTGITAIPSLSAGGVASANDLTNSAVLGNLPAVNGTGTSVAFEFRSGVALNAGGNSYVNIHAVVELP